MNKPGNRQLWKYAGMATQFLAGIGIALFTGMKVDQWFKIRMPLAVWGLPLLLILGMIIRIIYDTSPKK